MMMMMRIAMDEELNSTAVMWTPLKRSADGPAAVTGTIVPVCSAVVQSTLNCRSGQRRRCSHWRMHC